MALIFTNKILRLDSAIKSAGVAIDGVSVGVVGDSSTVTVSPASLQKTAQPIIDAFDWSDAAQDKFEIDQAATIAKSALADRTNLLYHLNIALGLVVQDQLKSAVPAYIPADSTKLATDISTKVDSEMSKP